MSDQDQASRNLPASERKIRKAREDGQVARSRDLGHLMAVGVGVSLLIMLAPELSDWMRRLLEDGLRFNSVQLETPEAMLQRLGELTFKMLVVVLPMGLVMALVAIGAGVASGGWNFTTKALQPQFSRLNPMSGIGRMFSKQHLGDVAKAMLLAVVLGVAGALYLNAHIGELSMTLAMPMPAAPVHAARVLGGGVLILVLILAAGAAIDVPLQRFMLMERLKMTHEEMKQEIKQTEGNVEVKGRMKAKMREMARRRMLAAVPTADLVVMNPTHYAVALKYDDAKMAAPRVVAKGTDLLAFKIKELAKNANVPVLRSPPLARALYAHVDLDGEVPAQLFAAVAQVLAFIYGLRNAGKAAPTVADMYDLTYVDVPPELDPHDPAFKRKSRSPQTARPQAQNDSSSQ